MQQTCEREGDKSDADYNCLWKCTLRPAVCTSCWTWRSRRGWHCVSILISDILIMIFNFLQHYFSTMLDQAVELMPCWFILCIITLLWFFKYAFMDFHIGFCISHAFFFPLCANTLFNAGTDNDTFRLFALLLFCEFLKMLLCFLLWNHTFRFEIYI